MGGDKKMGQNTLYTIGYRAFDIAAFLSALKEHHVDILIDVRSKPFCRHHPCYNKPALEESMKAAGIDYQNYIREFGGRQEDIRFYDDNGMMDYEVFAASEQFMSGVVKVRHDMSCGKTIAFMCAEEDPLECHRALLVARAFDELGCTVIHLLPEHQTKTQRELEEELLNRIPESMRSSVSGDTDKRRLAYRLQNQAIWRSKKGSKE